MWHPPANFITLHCECYTSYYILKRTEFDANWFADAWIVCMGLLGLIVIAPYGNVAAIDAYFFGASASTESGLNTYVSLQQPWIFYLSFSPGTMIRP